MDRTVVQEDMTKTGLWDPRESSLILQTEERRVKMFRSLMGSGR